MSKENVDTDDKFLSRKTSNLGKVRQIKHSKKTRQN